MTDLLKNWIERHRQRHNFWLHMVGIPACYVAAPVLLALKQWQWAIGMFVGGYVLQFLGHAIEGNSSGEAMIFRFLLRRKQR